MFDQKNISHLDKDLVHKICSGQVVITLASAVKEILENSLDAKSSKIGFGGESIEVVDNGCGIREDDFDGLSKFIHIIIVTAGKYCTSKLRTFDDLSAVGTYGFRGEALSSLCYLSHLTIHTCAEDSPIGTFLEFDFTGKIVSKKLMARPKGTTVCIGQLFHNLPVRRRNLTENTKLSKEFGKAVSLLTAYCIVSVNVQISCLRIGKKGEKINVLSNGPALSVKDNIATVFGHSQIENLIELDSVETIDFDILEEFDVPKLDHHLNISLQGFISKPLSCNQSLQSSFSISSSPKFSSTGRSSSDRQYVYVNGRPCDMPKITNLATDLWRRCSRESYSASSSFGVQMPNRSMTNQFPVLVLMYTMPSETVDINLTPDKRILLLHHERYVLALTKAILSRTLFDFAGIDLGLLSQSRTNLDQSLIVSHSNDESLCQPDLTSSPTSNSFCSNNQKRQCNLPSSFDSSAKRATYNLNNDQLNSSTFQIVDVTHPKPNSSSIATDSECVESASLDETNNTFKLEPSGSLYLETVRVKFSMEKLRHFWTFNDNSNNPDRSCDETIFSVGNFKPNSTPNEAERELNIYFRKDLFQHLEVVGQFNLGFIVARHDQDLFIIDQHASDEKYRFEQLVDNYRFKSQPLVVPLGLNLSIPHEQILMCNLDVFAKNGFAFRINEDAKPGQQVHLVATPMLEDKVFNINDVEEMLFVLSETCILTNMGTMDHPWNCPHGRPTMRHLFHLGILENDG